MASETFTFFLYVLKAHSQKLLAFYQTKRYVGLEIIGINWKTTMVLVISHFIT